MRAGPVLAVERRNARIQAIHTGHAILLDAGGSLRAAWGDDSVATYWRSAAKPMQAVPFAAIAERLGLGDAEIALACGSHAAEPFHVAAARRILEAADVAEAALRCGVHDPGPQAGPMPASGWGAIHNNCSGKHAAMLAVCRDRGFPLESYLDPAHPLQRELRRLVAEAGGLPGGDVEVGVDGCGLPTYFAPLSSLARSMQWLRRGGATHARVLAAMASESRMVGGTGNSDTDLPLATQGRIVSKYGALGVVAALDRESGEALAVKMDAGGSVPARAVALAVAEMAGWLRGDEAQRLVDHVRPAIRNHAGLLLGQLETNVEAVAARTRAASPAMPPA